MTKFRTDFVIGMKFSLLSRRRSSQDVPQWQWARRNICFRRLGNWTVKMPLWFYFTFVCYECSHGLSGFSIRFQVGGKTFGVGGGRKSLHLFCRVVLKSGPLRIHFQHSAAKLRGFEQNTDMIKFWLSRIMFCCGLVLSPAILISHL